MRRLMSALALVLLSLPGTTLLAQTESDKSSREYKNEVINLETAPIKTRADLVRYLSNQDPSNPLNELSEAARSRLIDTLTVNSKGQISSLYIDDIRSELTPTDAYKVFSLFGMPELAASVNNGTIRTALDAKIRDMGNGGIRVHPATVGYYCNGGYCTENERLTCVDQHCTPPP